MRKLVYVLLLLVMPGCDGLKFQPTPPSRNVVWFVGYDPTYSVPGEQFAEYPELVRTMVLERLQPGDTVVILCLGRSTPATFVLAGRLSHVKKQVTQIYAHLRQIKQSSERKGTTNFGSVFEHVRQRIALDQRLHGAQRVSQYILVVVTDGIPTGVQTLKDGSELTQADARVLFLGVEASMQTQLRELSVKAGITEPERVLVVPFAHWRELEPSLPVFMDQPANPSLKKALSRLVGPNGTVRR